MRNVTLQDLCLKVIVSKFKWYCEVYSTTEDSCLKLKFEFLKKRFSFLILQKLNERGRIEPEWLDFLINKYLKVLDAEWLKPWPWETVCHRLSEIGTNLEEVVFARIKDPEKYRTMQHACTGPWEEVLCYLPNVKSVTFRFYCTDEFLLSFSKFCKCVEILDICYSSNVSDKGLMHLCCKDNDKNIHSPLPIKEVLLFGTKIRDKGITYVLKNMPSLEKIDNYDSPETLYYTHKSDNNTSGKVKPYNLTHLHLSSDITLNIFTACSHLKSLSCFIHEKHDLDIICCSQLQELEELCLLSTTRNHFELNDLLTLNGKKLISLTICQFSISLTMLAQICPKLTSLKMTIVIFQYNSNDSVPVFHNLETVEMNYLVITEAVTCLLSSAPKLKQLFFRSCNLRSSYIKIHILRCCEQCELNVIDFDSSDVELQLIRDVLLTCSTLQTLKLGGCKILYNYDAIHELLTLSTSLPNKLLYNYDAIHELQTLSTSLPNKPHIDMGSDFYYSN